MSAAAGTSAAVRTTCPYCGVGCGVLARRANDTLDISGDPQHPANSGRLCSKGAALGDTLGPEGRLLHPGIGGRRTNWDEALGHVAQGLMRTISEHGPDAVAFYVSGQLLTEDYYVANKLMKGFIGAANIDTNSRLCMASAVAGHARAFGADVVPGCYEDLEQADLIVLAGSNAAWCHPVLFQRIAQAKEARPQMRLVVIDPRRTPTADCADLHLPIRAGSDAWLFNGLLAFLHRHGFADAQFVNAHTGGAAQALQSALDTAGHIQTVAAACQVDAARLSAFYELFARHERTVTVFSQGINQSSSGTDKVNSIINCHLLTGRIGRPGMGPFSITGQPNAMGGREVGGAANLLAAHMELAHASHRTLVQEFWRSPRIAARPGLKAVELFEAIDQGRIRALWIIATNPLVSLPDADRARAALARCPLVIVSDCTARTDTAALAHVLLPAAAWGEKDGTVTNSERRISRQRAFMSAPGEARPDWWIISEVAKRMGFGAAFTYASPHEIFTEHAQLSAAGNDGSRAFDIGGLAGLSREEYDTLEPIQWPVPVRGGGGTARLFGDGRFCYSDHKARFIPVTPRLPAHAAGGEFPLVLNTGRIRDQWHTMTRTGRSARLSAHLPQPYVDVHPQDALLAGLRSGDLARVATRWGSMVARLRSSGETARGTIFVPIHWNAQFASDARVGALVNPVVDLVSGQPELKHTAVRIDPFHVDWHGFVLTRQPITPTDLTWWTLTHGRHALQYEIAGRGVPQDWQEWARRLLGANAPQVDYLDYHDRATCTYRAAHLIDEHLAACLFVSPRAELPPREWLAGLFEQERLVERDRGALLAGTAGALRGDPGPIVCSCFGVGRNTLRDAIAKHQATSARQVGELLRAGTQCGSCVAEINSLLMN